MRFRAGWRLEVSRAGLYDATPFVPTMKASGSKTKFNPS